MCACKDTDVRESQNDSILAVREGHGSRGETFHPPYRENPVSFLAERGVLAEDTSQKQHKNLSSMAYGTHLFSYSNHPPYNLSARTA
jgi:hypothetical protein